MKKTDYQLIIIGGGPAGLTAGLYAARGRLNTLLIEKGATGGQVLLTDWVDNYPGFYDGITGFELMDKMTAHVDRFGLEKKFAAVTAMDLQGEQKKNRMCFFKAIIISYDRVFLFTLRSFFYNPLQAGD
ncbi:MAG: FAD-binding protein, partial [Candidatus Electrothrix sp. AR5]|nr:FAD-binding protein [Candidatus Electrothrix sp. AR5]